MKIQQVRRASALDEGCLIGIIAQANVEGGVDGPEQIIHLPPQISRQAGIANQDSHSGVKYLKWIALTAGSMATGACLMYLFDPARRKSRRHRLVAQAQIVRRQAGKLMDHGERQQIPETLAGVPPTQGGSTVKPKPSRWRPFLRFLGTIGLALLAQSIKENNRRRLAGYSAKPVEAHSRSKGA